MLSNLKDELLVLDNRARFIKMIIDGKLKVNNRPKADIVIDLEKSKFDQVSESFDYLLGRANFKTIVVSYSSDGILNEEQLTELLIKHGEEKTLNFRKIPYRRYKRTANDERDVLEYLIAINK